MAIMWIDLGLLLLVKVLLPVVVRKHLGCKRVSILCVLNLMIVLEVLRKLASLVVLVTWISYVLWTSVARHLLWALPLASIAMT